MKTLASTDAPNLKTLASVDTPNLKTLASVDTPNLKTLASVDTPKNTITTKNMQAQKQVSKMGLHCPQFFVTNCWRLSLLEFALHVLHWKYPKNERN